MMMKKQKPEPIGLPSVPLKLIHQIRFTSFPSLLFFFLAFSNSNGSEKRS